ncbi:LOW QUALITY PROTEIN: transcription initiation factor TFIID subunit 2-like [Amphiura filiformis]|uniref:LOW QUALITY PROTEIN: transcription initiation factor TFIID subunit 2-like n=1 Tax=Amphiura filiformis TaxID=82378 RepID=UPI003B215173
MSRGAKRQDRSFESPRDFRLSHQILCITGVNFSRKSIIGYVELHLLPLRSNVNRIKINSKQCRIYRACINEVWEASFLYSDPTLAVCQNEAKQHDLNYFSACHYDAVSFVDPDKGNGELNIKIPQDAMYLVNEQKMLRVSIEFSLERPSGGMHFVVPEMEGSMAERGAHMFTYGIENACRLWFPCIDSYSEPCTWKLEFTVDAAMIAVSCGDLIETVYTPDMKKKTFHYVLNLPTSAANIALAVGPFEVLVDPYMPEVTHFCLPKLMPLLEHTTEYLHQAFDFLEESLGTRYPFSYYKQVFVDEAFVDAAAYMSVTIFNTNLLHSSRIIDQTFLTRRLMAQALAEQFFGCFINPETWSDAWLTKGISKYLTGLLLKKTFGVNEYRYHINRELTDLCNYEQEIGGVVLHTDPIQLPGVKEIIGTGNPTVDEVNTGNNLYFPNKHPHTISWKYMEMREIKAHLVMRLIELKIGQDLILQVFNKLLSLATQAATQKFLYDTWSNMLISTLGFLKLLSTVSGKDLNAFLDQWLCRGGIVQFQGSFHFNRKRNVVELELRQDPGRTGIARYVGPLQVTIQELDGSFTHTLQVEDNLTKGEITCHSKSRRHKKKKIPLINGEEVDMDLSAMDADSPVLWIRVDTEMTLLRQVIFQQPDYQWQYQLRYERDIVAQIEAIQNLENFASQPSVGTLTETIENDQCFYRVRMTAAHSLTKIANGLVASYSGHTAMIAIFKRLFGAYSCPDIVRQNKFSNFQSYFLQKTIPVALAKIRNAHGLCPKESLAFLVELIKYNDNNRNKFSDNYYRAALIDALTGTVTPAVAMVSTSTESLTPETKVVLEEVTRCLNLEKLLPCYHHTVTVACLKAILTLQKNGHLPSDPTLFQTYAQYGHFMEIRLAALEALVDYVKVETNADILSWLLDIVEQDPVPTVRHTVLHMLIRNPPFKHKEQSALSTDALVERLWTFINSGTSHDSRLRCDAVDFYYVLFGKSRPSCLPIPELGMVLNLKERKTTLNPALIPDSESYEKWYGKGKKNPEFHSSFSSFRQHGLETAGGADEGMMSDLDSSFDRKRHSSSPIISPGSTSMQSSSYPEREGDVSIDSKIRVLSSPVDDYNESQTLMSPPGQEMLSPSTPSSNIKEEPVDSLQSDGGTSSRLASDTGDSNRPGLHRNDSKQSLSSDTSKTQKKKKKKEKHKHKKHKHEKGDKSSSSTH